MINLFAVKVYNTLLFNYNFTLPDYPDLCRLPPPWVYIALGLVVGILRTQPKNCRITNNRSNHALHRANNRQHHTVPGGCDYPTDFNGIANKSVYYNGICKTTASPSLSPARANKILPTFVIIPTEYGTEEENRMEPVYILHLGIFAHWVTGDKHDCFEA